MMQKWFYSFALLTLIVLFAFFLRTYSLNTTPVGAHPDEASYGLNAYAILETGKDEFGKSFPLIFTAYGDQKLPIYAYSVVPSIKLFGLTNRAVRMPGVLAGSLLCVFVYLFLKQFHFGNGASILGALITATSPWLIILSRLFGFESGVGLLFFVIGLLFLMKSRDGTTIRYLLVSAIFLGLTWYCYIAYRIVSTALILVYILIYLRSKSTFLRKGLLLMSMYIVIVLPLIISSFSGNGTSRFTQVFSTPSQGMVMTIDEDRGICAKALPKVICYLNSNKMVSYTSALIGRYVSVLSAPYLFIDGDKGLKFMNIDGYALMYMVLLPMYILGFVSYIQKIVSRSLTKNELFILLGLLLSPLPAVIVSEAEKVRISAMYPFVVATCLYGLTFIMNYFKRKYVEEVVSVVVGSVVIISTIFFMVSFTSIHVQKYETSFHTHVAKLMRYLGAQDTRIPIYIKSIDEAIVLYAYYNVIRPEIFQAQVIRPPVDSIGFSHATDLGNIHRTDKNLDQLYCAMNAKNTYALYATNEDLMRLGRVKKVKKIVYSGDMVHELLFVYDTRDIVTQGVDCAYLLNQQGL